MSGARLQIEAPPDSPNLLIAAQTLTSRGMLAARDAGLQNPAEVTLDTLRQTYLENLVRQGAR